jgi:thiamine biosynthesis lipoprotein
MRETRIIMGMPVTLEIVGGTAEALERVFAYFTEVDERFSTYKSESEITKLNRGEITIDNASPEMQEVFALAEKTRKESRGYFSITKPEGSIDPSGLVKGWAIRNAARLVERMGYHDYFLDVAGDIQPKGADSEGRPWTIGIRNPFNRREIVKVLYPGERGVATSGTYIRGQHIYNPHQPGERLDEVVSLTVVGPNVYDADRFATAAFAMERGGIAFIEELEGFEGYSIDSKGLATMTSGFEALTTV